MILFSIVHTELHRLIGMLLYERYLFVAINWTALSRIAVRHVVILSIFMVARYRFERRARQAYLKRLGRLADGSCVVSGSSALKACGSGGEGRLHAGRLGSRLKLKQS